MAADKDSDSPEMKHVQAAWVGIRADAVRLYTLYRQHTTGNAGSSCRLVPEPDCRFDHRIMMCPACGDRVFMCIQVQINCELVYQCPVCPGIPGAIYLLS